MSAPSASMLSAEVVEAYTEGDCWHLALALRAKTGWPMIFANPDPRVGDYWEHVAVRMPDGRILDVEGVHNKEAWRNKWASWNGHRGSVYASETDEDIADLLADFTCEINGSRRYPDVDTEAVADWLLRTHADESVVTVNTEVW